MPLPVITDHFYVQAIFNRTNEDQVVNTFCFRNHRDVVGEGATDQALLESMRDLLDGFYGDAAETGTIGFYMTSRLFGLRYVIYDLGQPDAGSGEIDSATWNQGEGSLTNDLPPDCCVVITWRTANRGRSYRGRTYLGPLRSNAMDTDGRIDTDVANQIALRAPDLIGDPLTRDWELCVLSRELGAATPVNRGDVDLEFDTQRSRGHRTAPRVSFGPP